MSYSFGDLLGRLGAGEGLWLMAMSALFTLAGLLSFGKLDGPQFVSGFTVWVTAVFGSAAIAGFRDWKKQNGGSSGPTP